MTKDEKNCLECMLAGTRVMDYRISAWIEKSHSWASEVICQPAEVPILGFYTTPTLKTFKPCIKNCRRCSDQQTCPDCSHPTKTNPYYLFRASNPHKCVDCLPESARYLNQFKECEDCGKLCAECSTKEICTKCVAGYRLESKSTGKCLKICENGKFRTEANICQNCFDGQCKRCQELTGVCLECIDGYAMRGVGSEGRKECWIECGVRRFLTGKTTCQSCPEHCYECTEMAGVCTTCENGFNLQKPPGKANWCRRVCGPKKYWKAENTCSDCIKNCARCSELVGECQECDNGFVYSPEKKICQKVRLEVEVDSIHYSVITELLEVTFNQPVVIQSLKNDLKIELKNPTKSGSNEPNSVENGQNTPLLVTPVSIVLKNNDKRISAKLDFRLLNTTFSDLEIHINELIPGSIQSTADPRVIYKNFPIKKSRISFFHSKAAETAKSLAEGTTKAVSISSALLMVFSVSMAVGMIKIFQMLFFLIFINVELPANLSVFIFSFRKNLLDYIPPLPFLKRLKLAENQGSEKRVLGAVSGVSGAEGGGSDEDLYSGRLDLRHLDCKMHWKFEEAGMDCSAFVSLGAFITELVIFVGLKIVILMLLGVCGCLCGPKNEVSKVGVVGGKTAVSVGFGGVRGMNEASMVSFDVDDGSISSTIKQKTRKMSISKNSKNGINQAEQSDLSRYLAKKKSRIVQKRSQFTKYLPDNQKTQKPTNRQNPQKNQKRKHPRPHTPNCVHKLIISLNQTLNHAFFLNLFKAMELQAVIGAMISISTVNVRSTISQLSFIFAVTILAFYGYLIGLLYYLLSYKFRTLTKPWEHQPRPDTDRLITSMEILAEFKPITPKTASGPFLAVWAMLVDLIVPVALVVFVGAPMIQIALVVPSMLLILVLLVKKRPYKEKHRNFSEVLNKALFLVIVVVFLVAELTKDKMEALVRFRFIGFGVIGLICLLVVSNVLVVFWGLFEGLCRKMKGPKKTEGGDGDEDVNNGVRKWRRSFVVARESSGEVDELSESRAEILGASGVDGGGDVDSGFGRPEDDDLEDFDKPSQDAWDFEQSAGNLDFGAENGDQRDPEVISNANKDSWMESLVLQRGSSRLRLGVEENEKEVRKVSFSSSVIMRDEPAPAPPSQFRKMTHPEADGINNERNNDERNNDENNRENLVESQQSRPVISLKQLQERQNEETSKKIQLNLQREADQPAQLRGEQPFQQPHQQPQSQQNLSNVAGRPTFLNTKLGRRRKKKKKKRKQIL